MASALAHLQRGFHMVLRELILELNEVIHCLGVVCIDRNPLAALVHWINRIQPYRHCALQVRTNSLLVQQDWCPRGFVLGPVIIMTTALRIWAKGLEGISAAIDEEVNVRLRQCGRCIESSAHGSPPLVSRCV